jgi:hypothetical protein
VNNPKTDKPSHPNAARFFRVPRKLLDFAGRQALLLGLQEDAGGGAAADPEERRRRALDRAAEEWLVGCGVGWGVWDVFQRPGRER